MNCPNCGRFLGNIVATIIMGDVVKKVEGTCKKCGVVDVTDGDWEREDFCDEE